MASSRAKSRPRNTITELSDISEMNSVKLKKFITDQRNRNTLTQNVQRRSRSNLNERQDNGLLGGTTLEYCTFTQFNYEQPPTGEVYPVQSYQAAIEYKVNPRTAQGATRAKGMNRHNLSLKYDTVSFETSNLPAVGTTKNGMSE